MNTELLINTPQNTISSHLHRIAAKSANPTNKMEMLRNTILQELDISVSMLTRWEKNSSQPSFEQFVNLVKLLRAEDPSFIADHLIQYN